MAKRKSRGKYHGYLIIDKPAGMTSHDVVGRVRRVLGEKRVGHAGTLDPAAVGVLPIAVGLATRTVEYLSNASKTYVADITFGVETDSADGDGVVTAVSDVAHLTQEHIESALVPFRGDILQVPPMHSAIKVDGQKMYDLARQGVHVELPPRAVTIHELSLLAWEPPIATVRIHCSKGTYVRSLARHLGTSLGVSAYMSNLVRVGTGPFTLDDAILLEELEPLVQTCPWEMIAVHPDAALIDRPAIVLDDAGTRSWQNGNSVGVAEADGLVRVYGSDGTWVGVGTAERESAMVKPAKVVVESQSSE